MLGYKILKNNGFMNMLFNVTQSIRDGKSVRPIMSIFDEEDALYKVFFGRDYKLKDHIVVSEMNNDYKTRVIVIDNKVDELKGMCYVDTLRYNSMNGNVVTWHTIFMPQDMLDSVKNLCMCIMDLIRWYSKIDMYIPEPKNTINFDTSCTLAQANRVVDFIYCSIMATDEICNLKYSDREDIVSSIYDKVIRNDDNREIFRKLYDHIIENTDIESEDPYYTEITLNVFDMFLMAEYV